MPSVRKSLVAEIHELVDTTHRYVDCAVRVRVYRRGADGEPYAAELLKKGYGGVYDREAARYDHTRKPTRIVELKVHPGQVPALERIGRRGSRRVLCLGAPGGGKTMNLVVLATALGVRRANGIIGVVAPTRDRLLIVWRKLVEETLIPAGLVASISVSKREARLINGTLYQFRAAARRATGTGSPIAGNDWHDAVEDEQQDIGDDDLREVDSRGRINEHYQVFSSATNEPRHEFQMRLREYEGTAEKEVLRFSGPENVFTSLGYWEALKRNWTADDYDRYIRCLSVPKTGRVFPAFDYALNTKPLPAGGSIIAQLVYESYRLANIRYVIGWDPGVVVNASVILDAFTVAKERHWWAVDEVTTTDANTDQHAKDLEGWLMRRGIRKEQVIVIGDPHENKEADRSDYLQMQAAGFHVFRSNGGQAIERKHRISMTNALLCDAAQQRRFHLAQGPNGRPIPERLAEGLGGLMYKHNGEIDYRHKTYLNIAHWPEAGGYGLFPFEKFRGTYKPKAAQTANVMPFGRRFGT